MKDKDIKLIVIDLDGTMVDTLPGIALAGRYVLETLSCPVPDDDFFQKYIVGGAANLVKAILGEENKDLFEKAFQMFTEHYNSNASDGTSLYPGVKETIKYFYGKKRMAVATAKTRAGTLNILNYFDILKYFDMVVAIDEMKAPKPDPYCIDLILEKLGEEKQNAILVGDTPSDMQTAKNAGIFSCAVTYGYGAEGIRQKGEYDFIIDKFDELIKVL